ncbi:LON peptidase substrate-binding domain-containing protein [Brevundimonas sp. 2R-24]|uniref:LON peptidase substrate-binding domain-containing protein n=1 Tax=Peiella sedimenti TaxID=3061083 RepID=A0ABT8SK96_9CAUL|nr:LON peptidase substrate-binding domain-containing protein [Caulobacteraceae bacterium XZ-24]
MPQGFATVSDLPQVLPVFPLAGAILLPRAQLPLNIFEPRYLAMIDDAMAQERVIGMIQPSGGPATLPALHPIGCAGKIVAFAETSDGRYLITLSGLSRFRIVSELPSNEPYRQVRADFTVFPDDLAKPDGLRPIDPALFGALRAYLEKRSLEIDWDAAEGAPLEALCNSLSMALPFEPQEKQALLEALTVDDRCRVLTALMRMDAAETGDDEPGLMQ